MKRYKKQTAAALAVVVICVILATAFVVALEAAHDCEGVHCPICDAIHALTGLLRGCVITAAVTAICMMLVKRQTTAVSVRWIFGTPVTDRVRLLN